MLHANVPSKEKIKELSTSEHIHLKDEEMDGIEDLFQQLMHEVLTWWAR